MKVSYHTLKKENVADFLILTVTDRETDSLLSFIQPVLEPSVIYEGKDGKYGEDGSEMYGG